MICDICRLCTSTSFPTKCNYVTKLIFHLVILLPISAWLGLFSGLGCLSQVLSSTQLFSASLTHLDLSGNPSCLVTEEATVRPALCVPFKCQMLWTEDRMMLHTNKGYISNVHTVHTYSEVELKYGDSEEIQVHYGSSLMTRLT